MTEVLTVETLVPASSGPSAVSWPSIFAGALVAIALSLIFVALGAGFGAAVYSPWPNLGAGVKTFTVMTGIWMIVTQWGASLVGGYITGRTRVRWHGLHSHETVFRDTANGLVMWAVATVAVAALGAVAVTSGASDVAAQTAVAVAGGVSDAAAETARKAGAAFSVFTALSMLIGAFIASVAAAYGGHLRDEHI